ncbi:hypothetical protein [Nannocystis punicea]|uniref:Uncharacterized protein n=1 Tax=Nannocystis punicea TaxID=2995304 RepID=A0ABY7H5G8_9BACT|nr:hypothetical protein [Nannocystis poenicansa]WAS94315.1 hypothetical protein O0S08_49975 [Nannocystis poenicansa]
MRLAHALLVAAGLGGTLGCVVQLDLQPDCGDGYVDRLAGEECEPSQADSMVGFCAAGEVPGPGACDRSTCIFDRGACTRCGNGLLDPGEACDPMDMSSPPCPIEGSARCRSDCTIDVSGCPRACGDGVVDENEECDDGLVTDVTDKGAPIRIDCTTLDGPNFRAYGGGESTRCIECKWDRSNCHYCGNQLLESADVLDKEDELRDAKPEVCDGEVDPDPQALSLFCQARCNAGGLMVACAYACNESCDAFLAPPGDVPDNGCCTPRSANCPYNDKGEIYKNREPCCGFPPGDLPEDPCVEALVELEAGTTVLRRTCP